MATASVEQVIAARVLDGTARLAGGIELPVAGSSMVPTLHPGDVARIVRRDDASYRTGEIVLFACNGAMILHRVVGHTLGHLVTRGDNRFAPDVPVPRYAVLGVALTSVAPPTRHVTVRIAATLTLLALRIDPALGVGVANLIMRIERGRVFRLIRARR